MKRLKLLTSLTSLAVLTPVIPALTTSCSNNESYFEKVYWFDGTKIQDWVMEINDAQDFAYKDFCAWHNNEIVDIASFEMTSSNSDVIEVTAVTKNKIYNAKAKKEGSATLTMNIADANGHKQTLTVVDTVVAKDSKKDIKFTAATSEGFTWNADTKTITFTDNHIVRATLGTLSCDTTITYNVDLFSKLSGIEINNKNELTMRVEESYDVGLKRICIYPDGGKANQLDINIVYNSENK
ncbi:MAG: hypothetical protein HUJ52_02385 [Malacoplasma sp.]|nr:hypothetical protein [Malacoplasma sp.]